MSKYTTEVRYICEKAYGLNESVGYSKVNDILNDVALKVFDFDFPIFDEKYRKPLCIKILKHFYTREISEETVGLWKLRIDDRMNMIMPYYNQLYESATLKFNPLYDTEFERTRSENKDEDSTRINNDNGSSNANRDTVSKSVDRYSDTPQGSITDLEDNKYLTNARIDDVDGNEKTENEWEEKRNETASVKTVGDYVEKVAGKTGGTSYAKMLTEYRETMLNIDAMVISDLENLFMLVW